MTTRSGAKYFEGTSESDDSNLGTSINTTSNVNTSCLIDLNSTIRSVDNTVISNLGTMPVTLSFGDAMKAIPSFSGGTEDLLTIFINKCEFIFKHIEVDMKPIILDAIVTQLSGKASEAVRYREITSWEELKTHLRTIFGKTHSIPFLQKQLIQLKQHDKESVQDYANRLEKTYHELTSALTMGKTPIESKIIAQTVQAQALSIFISGINYNIRLILKATRVSTFEEAVFLAIEEEKLNEKIEYKTDTRNKFNKKPSDKSKIQCHRCSKYGHYSNECRTTEHKITGFKNTSSDGTNKYTGNQVKFCNYCKKNNHVISECRRRQYNEKKKREQGETSNSNKTANQVNRSVEEIENNVRSITYMEREHVTCTSPSFKPTVTKLFVDTGADMSLIKLSALKKQVIVNETERRTISGITANPVETYGTVRTTIDIGGQIFNIKFDVVTTDFRVPESGIIGRDFIKDNRIILDYSRDMFMMPTCRAAVNTPLIIPPRSNCVLSINADELIDHNIVTIKNQELNNDVIIANSISPVIGNKIVSNIINISEEPFIIDQLNTSNLDWEPYQEQVLTVTDCQRNDGYSRVKALKEHLKTDHLNSEEREQITNLCIEFSDIFFLEGDRLSATDIVTHQIKTPRCVKPINIRPYRLPWAYQNEIERQITEMKDSGIIQNSVSPFNFPLVVVKKKNLNDDGTPKLRVCVDFRKLNEITDNEAYGLPNLVEILDSLGSSNYFSTLDLAIGDHQVNINKEDTHKTAESINLTFLLFNHEKRTINKLQRIGSLL